jgi:predicted transcriptional regulator of viral defense system
VPVAQAHEQRFAGDVARAIVATESSKAITIQESDSSYTFEANQIQISLSRKTGRLQRIKNAILYQSQLFSFDSLTVEFTRTKRLFEMRMINNGKIF